MPDATDEVTIPAIPPGASPQEILAMMLPLVVKAASESSASSVAVATALSKIEARVDHLETACMAAAMEIKDFRTEKKRENDLREGEATKVREREDALSKLMLERQKLWHGTFRSMFTPAFVIQVVIILLGLGGIYMKVPDGSSLVTPDVGYHGLEAPSRAPAPSSP